MSEITLNMVWSLDQHSHEGLVFMFQIRRYDSGGSRMHPGFQVVVQVLIGIHFRRIHTEGLPTPQLPHN